MKVWINRDTCDSNLAACEQCFGQFLRTGVPDRGCVLAYVDDGSEDMTVYMHSDGEDHVVVIPAEMRETVSYEGWPQFVEFKPEFRKHEYPGDTES
ncbi:MAG: hypothetical protein ACK2T6_02430 [Anaerolineae bacterium]